MFMPALILNLCYKSQYTGQLKILVRCQCPVMLRKPSSMFVYHLAQQMMQRMEPFFQWQERHVLMSALSFPVPGWLFRAGHAVEQQGSRVWAGGALLMVEQLQ